MSQQRISPLVGAQGPSGATGPAGASASTDPGVYTYTYRVANTTPGGGQLSANDDTTATILYVNQNPTGSQPITSFIPQMTSGSIITWTTADGTRRRMFQVNGAITSSSGIWTIPVLQIGTLGTAMTAATVITVTFDKNTVPAGGSAGQVLGKNTATDYDLAWVTPSSGSSSSYPGTAWQYTVDAASNDTTTAPASGVMRFNNASIASVTELRFNTTDATGRASMYFLQGTNVSLTVGAMIVLRAASGTEQNTFRVTDITNISVGRIGVALTGYLSDRVAGTIAVAFQAPPQGPPTVISPGIAGKWTFDNSTDMTTAPAAGAMRINAAGTNTATELRFATVDLEGHTMGNTLPLFLVVGTYVHIKYARASDGLLVNSLFKITSLANLTTTTPRVGVTWVGGFGAANPASGNVITVAFAADPAGPPATAGATVTAYKPTAETRTTASNTADGNLIVALTAGSWLIESAYYQVGSGGTSGMNVTQTYSGTVTSSSFDGNLIVSNASAVNRHYSIGGLYTLTTAVPYNQSINMSGLYVNYAASINFRGLLVVSTAGSLGVNWYSVNAPSNATMAAGSYIRAVKVA